MIGTWAALLEIGDMGVQAVFHSLVLLVPHTLEPFVPDECSAYTGCSVIAVLSLWLGVFWSLFVPRSLAVLVLAPIVMWLSNLLVLLLGSGEEPILAEEFLLLVSWVLKISALPF